jgi:hypothetical protein
MEMKYRKYEVSAQGTIDISNANAKDIKDSTFLMVDGVAIKAKITVKRNRKK